MKNKVCDHCGQPKPLTEFTRHWNSRDGYTKMCRPCSQELSRKGQELLLAQEQHTREREREEQQRREQKRAARRRPWESYVATRPTILPGGTYMLPPNAWAIYTLGDPRTQAVRYVGMTQHLNKRRHHHLANDSGNSEKRAWVQEMARLGILPVMRVLEVVEGDKEEAHVHELRWMRTFIEVGIALLNQEVLTASGRCWFLSGDTGYHVPTEPYPLPEDP